VSFARVRRVGLWNKLTHIYHTHFEMLDDRTTLFLANYVQGRPKNRGHFFTACNFRNIDKICIKFVINQSHFILTSIRNLFESNLENKVAPSNE